MATTFIKSQKIAVFPAVHRIDDYAISKRTTEDNLLKFGKLSSNIENLNQVYQDPDNSSYIIFNIQGYWFRCLKSDVPAVPNLYAYIKVKLDSNIGYILSPTDGATLGEILDTGTPGSEDFKGLAFDTSVPPNVLTDKYYGVLVTNELGAPVYQNLKLDASEVRNSDNKSIAEEFNSEKITAGTINGLTIDATTGTLDIANDKTIKLDDSVTIGTDIITLGGSGKSLALQYASLIIGGDGGSGTITIKSSSSVNRVVTLTGSPTLSAITTIGSNTLNINSASLTVGDASGTGTITIKSNNAAGRSLTLLGSPMIGGSGSLTINDSPTISGSGSITINNSPTIGGTGSITINNSPTISGSGIITLNKSLTVNNTYDFTLEAAGDDRTLKISGANKEIAGLGTKLTLGSDLATTGTGKTTFAQSSSDITLTLPTSNQTLATIAGTEALVNKSINGISLTAGATGFEISGGVSSKTIAIGDNILIGAPVTIAESLNIESPLLIDAITNIYSQFTLGSSSIYTGNVTLRSAGSSQTTITGPNGGEAILYPGTYKSSVLQDYSESSTASTLVRRNSSANVYANAFYATSDERLKENIVNYKYHDSILNVAVKEFDYKKTGGHTIGFIAQELKEKFPELVSEDEKGYLAISESKLVYLLLEEVKHLKEEVNLLKGGK